MNAYLPFLSSGIFDATFRKFPPEDGHNITKKANDSSTINIPFDYLTDFEIDSGDTLCSCSKGEKTDFLIFLISNDFR